MVLGNRLQASLLEQSVGSGGTPEVLASLSHSVILYGACSERDLHSIDAQASCKGDETVHILMSLFIRRPWKMPSWP